jgi:hypothetical protein
MKSREDIPNTAKRLPDSSAADTMSTRGNGSLRCPGASPDGGAAAKRCGRQNGTAAPGHVGAVHVFSRGEKRQLRGRVFRYLNFDEVDFSSSDLRQVIFVRVSLRHCDFSRANLRGTVFLGCDLRGACFTGARFRNSRFDESWFVGVMGIDLTERAYIQSRGGCTLELVK